MSRYTVKVKKSQNETFLWGGQNIKVRLNSPLFFTLRVVDMGEPIEFGVYKYDATTSEKIEYGSLNESETFTIHLNDISGIYAKCKEAVDTKVDCFIESVQSSD
jgi:hypothetical protein